MFVSVLLFVILQLLPAMMKTINDVARGNVEDGELSRAKLVLWCECVCSVFQLCFCRNQLKASYLMATESQGGLVEDIAAQVWL